MKGASGRFSHSNKENKNTHRVPTSRITIRVDELIKDSYSRLVNGSLRNILASNVPTSNQLLIDYIHQIYDSYNISLPEEKDTQHSKQPSKPIVSHSISLDTHREQPESKVAQIYVSRRYNRHAEDQDSTVREVAGVTSVPQVKILGRSKERILRLKERSTNEYIQRSTLRNSTASHTHRQTTSSVRQTSASIKQKITCTSPQTKTVRLHDSVNINNFSTSKDERVDSTLPRESVETNQTNDLEVKAVFRYCVACEEPILQANIKVHEIKCSQLRELYTLSFQQIQKTLLRRINRMRQEIARLANKSQSNCCQVKQEVKRWLVAVENSIQGRLTEEFQQKYTRIQKAYYCESAKLVEMTHKLRWFMRIREQLRHRFNL